MTLLLELGRCLLFWLLKSSPGADGKSASGCTGGGRGRERRRTMFGALAQCAGADGKRSVVRAGMSLTDGWE